VPKSNVWRSNKVWGLPDEICNTAELYFVSYRRDNCPIVPKRNFDSLFNQPKCSCLFQHPQAGKKFQKKKLNPLPFYSSRSPRISQIRRPKKFLFDLIFDPDRLTGFFKLSAEKYSLIIRPLKRVQKQFTDHPMRQPALVR
jgi:hypothetical protein